MRKIKERSGDDMSGDKPPLYSKRACAEGKKNIYGTNTLLRMFQIMGWLAIVAPVRIGQKYH